MVTWSWERRNREYKYGCTRDWGVSYTSVCRRALHCVLGWLPPLQDVLETQRKQHLSQEGSRPPAPPRLPLLCSQEGAEVLLAALCVLLVHGNIQGDFLIQSWREGEDFPCDLSLHGDAQQALGLLRATTDQAGLLHQHSEKQQEYFRWAGANKSKWTESLYPSTINKVHHDWRL